MVRFSGRPVAQSTWQLCVCSLLFAAVSSRAATACAERTPASGERTSRGQWSTSPGMFGNNRTNGGVFVFVRRSGRLSSRVRLRFTPNLGTRRPHVERDKTLKTGIHPQYVSTDVTCSCGNEFTTHSTKTSGSIHVEVCSNCNPFYTGKQKILDTGGRVARFEARYGKRAK